MRYRLVGELLRHVSRFAVIGVVGGMAAACSSDAMRFSEHPFANPYSGKVADPRGTGSIDRPANAPAANAPAMPSGRVSSAPLAPVGVKVGSAPLRAQPPSITTPMPRESYASNTSGPGWSAEGGTAVTVSQGDSLGAISDRYGVPQSAILSANGMSAGQVAPGRRIIIPIYNASAPATVKRPAKPAPAKPAQAAVQPAPAAKPVRQAAAPEPVRARAVEPRPAPQKVAAAPAPVQPAPQKVAAVAAPAKAPAAQIRKVVAEPAMTGSVEPKAHPRPGRPAAVAAAQPVATAPKAAPKPVLVAKAVPTEPARKPAAPAEAPKPAAPKVAKVEAAKPAEPAKPVKVAAPAKPAKGPEPQRVAALAPAKTLAPEPAPAPKEPEATGALPATAAVAAAPKADFRWPARGRVISGFGGAGTNEGINISVPDGTPVKAAEAGTVAYAGSEVKGYGNLVLIRHDNGYVSAYAHNGDLDVKRGQKVARGQTIAKSGQSGNVTSPQLHFEIRKGATPVDPMPYLASN